MSRTVVIAGGGPTGLMLASELGLAGVQAVVVERLAEPSGYSRSLTLQARAREVLEQRGLTFFHDYPPVPSYNFGLIELHTLVDQDLLPLLLPQRDVERVLEKRAVELGADVRRGQEITGFTQDDDGVTVTVRDADREYEIHAAYLVGCDGGSSIVRKLAGIGFPGTASTINGLTSDLLTAPDVREFVPPTLNQRGMYAVVPLGAGRYRVTCLEFGVEKTGKDVAPTVEEFQASL
jgi:2-polyprenyl-6-methoxyphenol hydroxylase-like FAD-dependent oxidoreductase